MDCIDIDTSRFLIGYFTALFLCLCWWLTGVWKKRSNRNGTETTTSKENKNMKKDNNKYFWFSERALAQEAEVHHGHSPSYCYIQDPNNPAKEFLITEARDGVDKPAGRWDDAVLVACIPNGKVVYRFSGKCDRSGNKPIKEPSR